MKEFDAAFNGNIETEFDANDDTKADPPNLDEAIPKYVNSTKRIHEMMKIYLRQLERKIEESPQIILTTEESYTLPDNKINWTLIDKTVIEFRAVIDHIQMKSLVVKKIYDYLRLIEAYDDESPSPPLESEVARDIESKLKCFHDRKIVLCHSLQQMENKLKHDWKYIQSESEKLASLQLSLLDETDKSQDPALMVNLPKLVQAKAAYVSAREKWRHHKSTLDSCAINFEKGVIQIREGIEPALLTMDSEIFNCVQTLDESLTNFQISLDRLRKSVAEALAEVHRKLLLCDYRDQELCHDSFALLRDIGRINETEKVINHLSIPSYHNKQNRTGERVESVNYVFEETDSLHSTATAHPEVDDTTQKMSELSVTEEIQDHGSIGTVGSSVDDWKVL
ncbi:hypothetical protein BKA69DRAFT_1060336 [Paraphysoderma sedebokerense]|nr:hypothetical protein BKA69DRAFT_1060336 [Paraphysoderma sedebokerense]